MNLRKKLVSVVMTVYNQEKYLAEAIESILNQTYEKFELIIIDDGSTDDTLNIIRSYSMSDKRIRYLARENKGRVFSLNEAVKMSSGEYVAIMDSDDISYPERFEKEVDFLNRHMDVILVGTKIELKFEDTYSNEIVKEKNIILKTSNADLDRKDIFSTINDSFKIIHPTWMFRRELFEYISGYQDYMCEDTNFLFRTVSKGFKVDRIDEVLLKYRIHGESRSDDKNKLKADCLKFKTDYLMGQVEFPVTSFSYMVWGSDYSGQMSAEYLQDVFKKGYLVGYIDSFKAGDVDGIPIIKTDKIKEQKFDYIFICTNGGGEYARKYLDNLGYRQIYDYFKII